MTYEEVEKILNSKRNIPYPKLMNIRQNIKYNFRNVYSMLEYNIESEKKAIKEYEEAIKHTQNKSIQQLLERIILDEKTHLEIFNRLR